MSTKIRLQRQGKKKTAIYHVVVTDSRSARNGKFIEKLGTFNPGVNPPAISLNFDKALNWVKTGAEPSDAVRTILSHAGVLMKKHLDGGVAKGAITQDQADAKFQTWIDGKKSAIEKDSKSTVNAKAEAKKKALEAEKAVNAAKAEALAAKKAEAVKAAEVAAAPVAEEAAPEAPAAEATPSAE